MNTTLPLASSSLLAFAAAAAALIGLAYVIKLRRRRFEVPFARLWHQALGQKDAASWWQRMQRVASLLLMLIIAGLLFFAALDPTFGSAPRDARNVVVIIDTSASMQARDDSGGPHAQATTATGANEESVRSRDATTHAVGSGSRLSAAKAAAIEFVNGMSEADHAMVLAMDAFATPLSRFSNDVPRLRTAIANLMPTDTRGDLAGALQAAADALRDRRNPMIVIVSDGAFVEFGKPTPLAAVPATTTPHPATTAAPAALPLGVDLAGIDVRFVGVGKRHDNVGIVAFNVRRYVANKAAFEVYLEIANFGDAPVVKQVALYNGDTLVEIKNLTLPPQQRVRQLYRELPGGANHRLRATITSLPGEPQDALALDDEAFALLPARQKQHVLLVTEDNLYLEGAILIYDNIDAQKVTPQEYAANPAMAQNYHVVVFDDFTPTELPALPVGTIIFHPDATRAPIAVRGSVARPRITEVAELHPVMRWVTMSDVNFDESLVFAPDAARGEVALATAVRDPIIAARRDAAHKLLVFGFSLPAQGRNAATDLPLRVAFPLLLVNALDWFAGDGADLHTTYTTGTLHRIAVDVPAGAGLEVTDPLGHSARVPTNAGLASLVPMHTGVYQLTVRDRSGAPGSTMDLAANLVDPQESAIAPIAKPTLFGKELIGPPQFGVHRRQRVWWYLVLAVAALLIVEWWTYHRRVTV